MAVQRQRVVYINGKLVPESEAVISVFDRGFRWGDGVYDVERTFDGRPFRLRQHMDRLYRSLLYSRIDPGLTKEEMEQATLQVVEENLHLLKPGEDYTITQVVSRGVVDPLGGIGRATVVIYCMLAGLKRVARLYLEGARVVTPATRRTPPQCVSPKAKISNKMNHMVAEMEAKEVDSTAWALMLDLDGNIAECSGANFLFMAQGRLKVPHRRNVLAGITMETLLELAEGLGIPIEEDDYTPFDVYNADEAVIVGTTTGIVPVASLNGLRIGRDVPGPMTRRLWQAFSDLVGMDFVEQTLSYLSPGEREALPAAR